MTFLLRSYESTIIKGLSHVWRHINGQERLLANCVLRVYLPCSYVDYWTRKTCVMQTPRHVKLRSTYMHRSNAYLSGYIISFMRHDTLMITNKSLFTYNSERRKLRETFYCENRQDIMTVEVSNTTSSWDVNHGNACSLARHGGPACPAHICFAKNEYVPINIVKS